MLYPEGTFLSWGLFIPSFKIIAYVVDKQSDICRRYFLLQGLCVPIVKTTTYVCDSFNTSFCARDYDSSTIKRDYQTRLWLYVHVMSRPISNLNWKFWNKSTQQIKLTTSFIDLCFNKKIEQEKKNLRKISISKSIYVDTYYVLFVIIVTECNVSSNEIFFLTSQKSGGIASVNYLKVKNDVTYWNTIVPDRNQIHAAPNLLFLSS